MRKKLLLADDSITIQKVVELTFPSDEFEVVTAGNGRIAVDKAMAFLPDMVLCDVIMPQLDGYQVCEALRASEQLKNVPILLLNGAFEPYDAERAKSVGALGNVSKPFDPPALVARVKEILAERGTAAYSRPVDPMSIPMPVEEALEPVEAAATVPLDVAEPDTAPDYTYDDSETHPVSTIEVPMDVREMAARSLSLDAPVFATQEPDVLTSEGELSDFSETLHGPLDGELQPEPVQEIEAMEELEPVTATGEIVTSSESDLPTAEGLDFETDTAASMEILPQTIPPTPRSAPAPVAEAPHVEEFGGDGEFDPADLEAASVEPESPPQAPQPAGILEELPALDVAAAPALPPPVMLAAPTPSPAALAPMAPPPVAAAVSTAPGAFDNLVGTSPSQAPAEALPSAEVAVPVDMVQQIAQRVISQVSERVIREIAWDVIPGLAEKLIRAEIERIKARVESERD